MMETLFFSAFGLSLALWAVPGAVMTEALRRGLTRRWRSVSFVLLGTLTGDALWASVSFLFANILARNTVAHGLLGALETIVLLSLAWGSLKA
jgi:threonine/homoserine/homoserine lactone efflux protein